MANGVGGVVWCLGAIALATALAGGARFLRVLSLSGAIVGAVVGATALCVGGVPPAVGLVAFASSSALLGLAAHRLRHARTVSSPRTAIQVLANGGVVAICAIFSRFGLAGLSTRDWILVGLGSLAACTADTWATEVGAMAPGPPRSILTFRPLRAGLSGGVTLTGLGASVAGSAFLVCMVALLWPVGSVTLAWRPDIVEMLSIGWAGILASLLDSVLGAGLQRRYRCETCGEPSDGPIHCGARATATGGLRWMTNDAVNLLASLAGAGATALLLTRFASPV